MGLQSATALANHHEKVGVEKHHRSVHGYAEWPWAEHKRNLVIATVIGVECTLISA
jgi:hypothetical protein